MPFLRLSICLFHFLPPNNHFSNPGVLKQVWSLESPMKSENIPAYDNPGRPSFGNR